MQITLYAVYKMRIHHFVHISFVLCLSTDLMQAVNLTYESKPLSWLEAVTFCKNMGFILESNITEINFQQEIDGNNKEVWIGKYEELTRWNYIKGCFNLVELSYYKVELYQRFECQKLCQNQTFYSIKNEKCFCFDDDPAQFTRCRCNDNKCFQVWEHKLPIYDDDDNKNSSKRCIAAEACNQMTLQLKYHSCYDNHYTICDNGLDLNFTVGDYDLSATACHQRGSFIRWHPSCPIGRQYKTSGRRDIVDFIIKPYHNIQTIMLLHYYSSTEKMDFEIRGGESAKKLTFYCRSDEDIKPPEKVNVLPSINSDNPSSELKAVVLGVVLAIIFAIGTAVVLIMICARRRNVSLPCLKLQADEPSRRKTSSNGTDTQLASTINNGSSNIGNENYAFAKPFINESENKSNGYDFANTIDEKSNELNNTGNYSLAKETFEDNDYVSNADYDHLNKVVKNAAESNYSFTPGGEPKTTDEYDVMHSIRNNRKSCNETDYDHFTSKTNCDDPAYVTAKYTNKSKECDDYDHFTTK